MFFEIYDWPPFVIALIASVVAVAAGAAFELAVRACLKRPIPPSALALAEQQHRLEQKQLAASHDTGGEAFTSKADSRALLEQSYHVGMKRG